jgi:hypothetical protein
VRDKTVMGGRAKATRLSFLLACPVAVAFAVKVWLRPRGENSKTTRPEAATALIESPASISISLSFIAGTVIDTYGKPIGEARVCAISRSAPGSSTGMCTDSDIQGRYAVRGLAAGAYLVTAARAGFATGPAQEGRLIELSVDAPRVGIDIVLQPGGARVAGVAVDAMGGPVSHATVRGERTVAPPVALDVEADDLGRFVFWFPPGPIAVSARATAYAPARWFGFAPNLDVRLVLTPGANVRGLVVSAADGNPVANVEVRATPSRNHLSTQTRSSTSNAQGAFDIGGIEPGFYTIVATGEGLRGESQRPLSLGLGSTVENVRVEVSAAAQVTGRVLLSNTQPCEQGVVSLGPPDPGQPPPFGAEGPTPFGRPDPSLIANIGPGGLVHFRAVESGRYYVTVQCVSSILRDGPRVLDVGATTLSNLIWRVGPGSVLTVLTVDDRGRPVPGAEFAVHFPRWTESTPGLLMPARTNNEGRSDFSVGLYPGNYEITARQPFDAQPVRVELHEGDGKNPSGKSSRLPARQLALIEKSVNSNVALAPFVSQISTPKQIWFSGAVEGIQLCWTA